MCMSFFASELPMMVEFCVFAPTGLGEGCTPACDMVVLSGLRRIFDFKAQK